MKVVTYKCDACAKVKGETNHWFGIRLHRDLGTVVIMPFSKVPIEAGGSDGGGVVSGTPRSRRDGSLIRGLIFACVLVIPWAIVVMMILRRAR